MQTLSYRAQIFYSNELILDDFRIKFDENQSRPSNLRKNLIGIFCLVFFYRDISFLNFDVAIKLPLRGSLN